MILVDTSVLIAYLRGDKNEAVEKFDEILNRGMAYGISTFTYQEVLQGAATDRGFKTLGEYLDTQTLYFLTRGRESYADAAGLYFRCRKAGFTVRSTLDCLIAQTAMEHGLFLLHRDRDFDAMNKVEPALKIF